MAGTFGAAPPGASDPQNDRPCWDAAYIIRIRPKRNQLAKSRHEAASPLPQLTRMRRAQSAQMRGQQFADLRSHGGAIAVEQKAKDDEQNADP